MQVNRNLSGSPHTDHHDVTYQRALSLGDFVGGRLLAETGDRHAVVAVNANGRPTRLDGRRVHWFEPYSGERFSVIPYSVKGPEAPLTDEKNAT